MDDSDFGGGRLARGHSHPPEIHNIQLVKSAGWQAHRYRPDKHSAGFRVVVVLWLRVCMAHKFPFEGGFNEI